MPRLISVLDTNVYRAIHDADLEELKVLERSRSIVACPCYQVVQELLAHLAAQDDPAFGSCHAALARLGRHCRFYDGQRYQLRFLADALDQVAMSIFRRPLVDPMVADQFAGLVGDVVEGNVTADWSAFRFALEEVAEGVRESRATFSEEMRAIATRLALGFGFADGDLSAVLADKQRRKVLCEAFESDTALDGPAQMVYRQVAEALCVEVGEFPPDAIAQITRTFPTPLRFFNQVLKKTICDGWNLRKRGSIAHDLRISFLASGYARVDGCPVCLVTDDGLIHEAAQCAGTASYVLRLDEYRGLLRNGGQLPGEASPI